MINPFPTVFLALIAYAGLRIIVGLILVTLGYQHLVRRKVALRSALTACMPDFMSGYTGFFATYFGASKELVLANPISPGLSLMRESL